MSEALCPICSQPALLWRRASDHHYGNPGVWEVYRCTDCRHLFQYPVPAEYELAQYYPVSYYAHERPRVDFTPQGLHNRGVWLTLHYLKYCRGYHHLPFDANPLLAFAGHNLHPKPLHFGAPYFRQGGRLLDYGSGAGDAVAFMQYVGWQAEGIEINAAAAHAGREAGLHIDHGSIDTLEDRVGRYDYVMSSHCVEHVPDVGRLFRACFAALKPGGMLAIEVPNADAAAVEQYQECYYYLTMPVHVHIFTPASMLSLAQSTGFVNMATATYSIWSTQARAAVLRRHSHGGEASPASFQTQSSPAHFLGAILSLPTYVRSRLEGRGDCLVMTCTKPGA